jgi:LuxR family transcriptional regulator, quorum-sensing system regulator SdiA
MPSDTEDHIRDCLSRLKEAAPSGFAIALHVRLVTPTYLFQTYPKEWIDYYSQNGLVMQDPTVHWGFENLGTVRWSDLAHLDQAGIIAKAAQHGMCHGFTCAVEAGGTRSLSSFTHGARDFTDAEIAGIASEVEALHGLTAKAQPLSAQTRDGLTRMSIQFSHP